LAILKLSLPAYRFSENVKMIDLSHSIRASNTPVLGNSLLLEIGLGHLRPNTAANEKRNRKADLVEVGGNAVVEVRALVIPESAEIDLRQRCSLAECQNRPIDLLLTDVVMPGMSGRELADQMVDRFSNMKVLYMSGFTSDAIVQHGVLKPGISFLEKPFSQNSLMHKLREVFDCTRKDLSCLTELS